VPKLQGQVILLYNSTFWFTGCGLPTCASGLIKLPCYLASVLFGRRCWSLPGQGFPDVATRLLVRLLWKSLGVPVLILMDADPHGIEIMCVYRFGSLVSLS
jgi:hypothetical protein